MVDSGDRYRADAERGTAVNMPRQMTPGGTARFVVVRMIPLFLGTLFLLVGTIGARPPTFEAASNSTIYGALFVAAGLTNMAAAVRPIRALLLVYVAAAATIAVVMFRASVILLTPEYTWQQRVTGTMTWATLAVIKFGVALFQIAIAVVDRVSRP